MRAREFLLEYNRDKTAQMIGPQLINAFATGGDKQQYQFYDTTFVFPDGQPNTEAILAEVLRNLEEADPTKNKIYTPWLAREYAKQNIKRLEDAHVLSPMLAEYDKYKKRNDFPADAKDIMRLSYSQFYTIVGNYEPPPEPLKDKGQAREVYRDSNVRVIIPDNEQAACYYGQGTRWCTAATKGTNYFSRYSSTKSPLYILLPTKPREDGEKYQLHFGTDQFMDQEDENTSLYNLLTVRFPDLHKYFMEVEPEIKTLLPFTSDELLESIGKQIAEYIMEQVWEKVHEWESDDDSFKEWQIEEATKLGIINDEMSEDEVWDTIHEHDKLNDYLDYNDEVKRFVRDIKGSLKVHPETLKDISVELMETEDATLNYWNLESVYAYHMEDYFGLDRYGRGWGTKLSGPEGDIVDWVRNHISISRQGQVSYIR